MEESNIPLERSAMIFLMPVSPSLITGGIAPRHPVDGTEISISEDAMPFRTVAGIQVCVKILPQPF